MKPTIAIHKFASCDGCQLAFLNAGEALLTLATLVDIIHFAEAGPVDADAQVDIAFIEGSITTSHDADRIQRIRQNCKHLVTIGACATAGGLQALRNFSDSDSWPAAIYAQPEYIQSLNTSTPIREHVHVDYELWGCPVNTREVMHLIHDFPAGVSPIISHDKVCLECKRQNNVCVMVTRGMPCMGPVTRTGCGAICPHMGRDCYACYGPAENINAQSLIKQFTRLDQTKTDIRHRFRSINAGASEFRDAVDKLIKNI